MLGMFLLLNSQLNFVTLYMFRKIRKRPCYSKGILLVRIQIDQALAVEGLLLNLPLYQSFPRLRNRYLIRSLGNDWSAVPHVLKTGWIFGMRLMKMFRERQMRLTPAREEGNF